MRCCPTLGVLLPVILIALTLVSPGSASSFTVAAQSCTTSQYYDSSSFTCVQCATNQVATSDGFSCECSAGYKWDLTSTSSGVASPKCSSCPQASAAHRTICQTCDSSTTGYDSATGECTCASGGLVETDEAGSYRTYKSCVTCTAGSLLTNSVCVLCNDPRMTASTSTCTCTSDYVQINSVCLHQETANNLQASYPSSDAYTVTYNDLVSAAGSFQSSITSATISSWFYEAGVNCTRGEGTQWCQMLANMCVLNNYYKTHPTCTLFISLSNSAFSGFSGWTTSVGFLYFADTTVLTDTSLVTKYEFTEDTASQISIVLASYAFNGTFLGWRTLDTQLALCGGEYDDITEWQSFGTFKRWTCDVDINRIFRVNDTIFYDPYFIDSDGTYYPMPVIVENYRDASGNQPNDNQNAYYFQAKDDFPSTAQLVRRFFIVDNLSGRITNGYSTPDVVRVLAKAAILIHVRNPSDPGKIYPPRLVVNYHEVDVSGLDANTVYPVSTEFGIAYAMETSETYGERFEVYLIICAVACAVLFGLRAWRAYRGLQDTKFDMEFGFQLTGLFFRSVSHTFGVGFILFALSIYMAFKMAVDITLLIPADQDIELELYGSWGISCAGVLLGTLYTIWAQVRLDVFFIDWEAPLGRTFGSNSAISQASVSAWRTLFVANEFSRLQGTRLIDFNITSVFVLFLLCGSPAFGESYYNANCITPDGSLLVNCGTWARSGLLRVAVDAFFWVAVATVQVLFIKLVYQQWYKHPSLQLLDIMALSNVSVWILNSGKYAGYYLHGQSLLPRADTALADFATLLTHEAANMTPDRGLVPGSDCQEFSMFVAPPVRERYQAFLEQIRELHEQEMESMTFVSQMKQEFVGQRERFKKPGSNTMFDGQKAVNGLLKKFIKEMQTTYKDTHIIPPCSCDSWTFDRLLKIPPKPEDVPHALLRHDTSHEWLSVLYEGVEFDLLLFDIYLFTLFDVLVEQPVLAMMFTFLVQKLIDLVRHEIGIRNLGEKSLIGEKFFL